MTFERSHGKARPTLPRASDLSPLETAGNPTVGRAADGRFTAGNPVAKDARVKASIKKALGSKASSGDVRVITGDANRVFYATLRTLPSDAAPVRAMAALHARHFALAAFFGTKAAEVGLTTPEGMELLEVADRQSQRAERVLVTALDIASKLSKKSEDDVAPWEVK